MTMIEQRRKAYADFQAGTKRDNANRFAVAGRFLFYVAVVPFLLVSALIAVAVLFY